MYGNHGGKIYLWKRSHKYLIKVDNQSMLPLPLYLKKTLPHNTNQIKNVLFRTEMGMICTMTSTTTTCTTTPDRTLLPPSPHCRRTGRQIYVTQTDICYQDGYWYVKRPEQQQPVRLYQTGHCSCPLRTFRGQVDRYMLPRQIYATRTDIDM